MYMFRKKLNKKTSETVASILLVSIIWTMFCVLSGYAQQKAAISIEGNGFVVYHDKDTVREAEIVAEEAGRCLPVIKNTFGPQPNGVIRIYLADTIEQFNRKVGREMPVWVVGVALGGRNTVVLKSYSIARRGGSNIRKTVRHELTHVVLDANYEMDFLPRWLNEGIAMWQADEPTVRGSVNLTVAALLNRFIPIENLDSEFSTVRGDVASVCYGESRSLVEFILTEYGQDSLLKMLAYTRTDSTDDPFVAVLGVSASQIYQRWRVSMRKYIFLHSILSGVGLFWLMGVLVLVGYARARYRGRRILARWDKEDV